MGWRWRTTRQRRRAVDAEIDTHIEMSTRDRVERGVPPDEAYRQARLEIGNVGAVREESRAVWGFAAAEQLLQDVREGTRILTRSPGISAAAIFLIALVIGGNTTLYSVVHGLLTKPAPGIDPIGLVAITWAAPDDDTPLPEISYPGYVSLATQTRGAELVASRELRLRVSDKLGTFGLNGAGVSANYFRVLDARVAHGRAFTEREADLEGGSGLVAVVSERFARDHAARVDDAVGLAIEIDGYPATVIGVVARPFQGAWTAELSDVWVPIVAFARVSGTGAELRDRSQQAVSRVIGRRKADVSREALALELTAIAASDIDEPSAPNVRRTPRVLDYTGIAGTGNLVEHVGPRFLAVMTIVALITVVIVCANVANLMLARAIARQREMAVRQSFGASRGRILRLVVAEGVTLAFSAWTVACLFTYWMTRSLAGIIPPSQSGNAQVLLDLTPDWNVLAYAMGMALAATLAFTAGPALRSWHQDLLPFLKAGERGVAQGRSGLSRGLVVCQIALAVVLLVSAAFGYRSLALMSGADVGFDASGILLITVDNRTGASAARTATLRQMRERVEGVPGVSDVSYATATVGNRWPTVPVRRRLSDPPLDAEVNHVGPQYFDVLGVALLSGEPFRTDSDDTHGVVVNEHLAGRLWPGESALGKTLYVGAEPRAVRVAGTAPNVLPGGYRQDTAPPIMFMSMHGSRAGDMPTIMVRYTGSREAVGPSVTQALREAAPAVPILVMSTYDEMLREATWLYRTLTRLLLLFAAGSLAIATIGLYAAMAFSMRRRVRDFAIRLAIGASARQVVGGALREGLMLTTVGLGAGLLLGAYVALTARGLLRGVAPTDARTYLEVACILGATSLIACYLPARRTSRVNPIDALRSE